MSSPLYEITESRSQGKIAIATANILPGQLIIKEHEPVIHVTIKCLQKYASLPDFVAFAFASYHTYKTELSLENRTKFDALFGPVAGSFADDIRLLASAYVDSEFVDGELCQLTESEVEDFVRVVCVMRLNMMGEEGQGHFIFGELTRLSHSCAPNCVYEVDFKSFTCYARALCHINVGDELTQSYNGTVDLQPTHIRRQKYLETKEFTCHCPRCDAPGDDTRQFDCFDPACRGVMMVCQPINQEEVRVGGVTYTGVEYVDPYLLPCTACGASAPPEYQSAMFALETKLCMQADSFLVRYNTLVETTTTASDFDTLHRDIIATNFPHRHASSLPILCTLMGLTRVQLWRAALAHDQQGVNVQRKKVQQAAHRYIAAQERILPLPCAATLDVLRTVCMCCIVDWTGSNLPRIFQSVEAKVLLQKFLRMYLLLHGRHDYSKRETELYGALLAAFTNLPLVLSTEVCAFCGESPLLAALTLKQCGRCKQVMYCSAGCQRAHWKLHKKTCK